MLVSDLNLEIIMTLLSIKKMLTLYYDLGKKKSKNCSTTLDKFFTKK